MSTALKTPKAEADAPLTSLAQAVIDRLSSVHATQRELATACGIGSASLSLIIHHGRWPRSRAAPEIANDINAFFVERGLAPVEFDFTERPRQRCGRPLLPASQLQQEDVVLFKKFSVSPAAKKAFCLFKDPFSDDVVNTPEDVFLSPANRYVFEAMLDTARNGGFRAVIGESGAGKTTIRQMLAERLRADQEQVILIEPYVLGMEHSDMAGKTLKSGHIAEAVVRTLAPGEKSGHGLEKRFDQARNLLRASMLAGNKHVLVIEEAHGLPTPTLKHLKRWAELREGMRRLLSILLIGQPELRIKLSGSNAEVREVVQRCEQCELEPLDAHLEQFIKHKFARIGADAGKALDAGAYPAIVERLTHAGRDGRTRISFLYPLAVGNLVAGSLNLAADLGVPTVTADVVRRV